MKWPSQRQMMGQNKMKDPLIRHHDTEFWKRWMKISPPQRKQKMAKSRETMRQDIDDQSPHNNESTINGKPTPINQLTQTDRLIPNGKPSPSGEPFTNTEPVSCGESSSIMNNLIG
ncbi:unnamed protein product [Arabis nemorensis]|uniref:Uncharacterized protein n=1 Tax=Arabis nemorensis TaxID=586526 RepID=A0A565AWU6_9BRAS|nr:unnamed protein product [Arabis nemorensis]